jgi:P27 family predicted phage terminase small subunit
MSGPAARPNLAVVREGNPGHKVKAELERGLKLPPQAPPEPDWKTWFPPARGAGSAPITTENKRARDEASKIWSNVVKTLDAQGLLCNLDEYLLADFALAQVRLAQLERSISLEGFEREGQKGTARHPSTITVKGYREQIRYLVGQLGLSPVARDGFAPEQGADDGEGDLDF